MTMRVEDPDAGTRTLIRRTFRVLLVLVLSVSATLAMPAKPARATSCTSTWQNTFAGFYHDSAKPQLWEGASGYIVVRDAQLCTGGSPPTAESRFSMAWVMIASSSVSQARQGYAQVGYVRSATKGFTWFSEWSSHDYNNGVFQRIYSATQQSSQFGTRHKFMALWNGSCECIRMTVDGVYMGQSGVNPFNSWERPMSPQFAGEVTNASSNIPGTSGARAKFTALGAQNYSNVVIPMSCTMIRRVDLPRFYTAASGCEAFDIWAT